MIRLAVRLTVQGGREAVVRLVVVATAVAVGVCLLLATLAGINAVHAQNDRYAWVETGVVAAQPAPPGAAPVSRTRAGDPEWWLLTPDEYAGKVIGRVDLAATGPHSPVPPGIPRLPRAGEYYASPAMVKLLRTLPPAQLADRYPGHLVGTIGDAALPSADTLVIVIGRPIAALAHQRRAVLVTSISTTPPDQCNGDCLPVGYNRSSMDLILAVVAAAILVPVMIFIGSATRLSAARRDQRFAAMRLVGATPRQIAVIAAVESTVAAGIGALAGFGLFALLRPAMASIPFTGSRFFTSDLSLSWLDTIGVLAGVPVAAAVAARLALRRVIISPLGVTRRVTPTPPRAWRLVPLASGLAELGYFVVAGRPETTGGQILAYTIGVVVTMVGLVVAGPWLTLVGARAVARRARRADTLIAARRLADNPQAGFRAISGLVLGLFVATVALGVIVTFDAGRGAQTSYTSAQRSTLVDDLVDYGDHTAAARVRSVPAAVVRDLSVMPGVRGTTEVHAIPGFGGPPPTTFAGVVDCREVGPAVSLGACPAGAVTASFSPGLGGGWGNQAAGWKPSALSRAQVAKLPLVAYLVTTDGRSSTIEAVRSLLESGLAPSGGGAPQTVAESIMQSSDTQRSLGYQRLADVVILMSLPIAGCTLAVSVVAGLNERKRPFSLLRLTGAPIATLRRVVMLESAVPLLAGAVVAAGVGLTVAALFVSAQLDETLRPLGVGYYAVVAAGVVASLAIIASTMPTLARITGPETARND